MGKIPVNPKRFFHSLKKQVAPDNGGLHRKIQPESGDLAGNFETHVRAGCGFLGFHNKQVHIGFRGGVPLGT